MVLTMQKFDIAEHPIIFDLHGKVIETSAWIEHVPFAFFLISALRPKVFIELGVYTGNSFNAFCHAVRQLKTETTCYGVDTWRGDEHASFYNEALYEDLLKYQQKEFDFASLLKMTFDEALDKFQDGTVDLLHIDGYHTYEAVRHDFESWLPKMSGRGVVIFHDTEVRERNFGVYKLFEEISSLYPSFNFKHGYGLGVVAVGDKTSQPFMEFIRLANGLSFYQNLFERLGNFLALQAQIIDLRNQIDVKDNMIINRDNMVADLQAQLRKIMEAHKTSQENE